MASKLTLAGGIALAASGIGKETSLAFAEAGARGVIFADVNEEGAKAAAEESKRYAKHAEYRSLGIKVDVADVKSLNNLVNIAITEFGRIDYAVNSAGQEPHTFSGSRRHGTRSLGRGSIVLLGSISSLLGAPGMVSYTTAKHAIIGIMRSAAVDRLALKAAIRINAVCPGWVDTPIVKAGREKNPMLNYAIDNVTPFKRAATVDEVANYIIFLASPLASFINGTALPIDAGLTLPAPPDLSQASKVER